MKILCADIGTGTQDIYLYDSRLDMENGFKLVVPSPTMMVFRRLGEATRKGQDVVLTGVTMGGGPSQWAVENHLRNKYNVFATPEAARSFNDDLEIIREMGIIVISEDEVSTLSHDTLRLELRDFDYGGLIQTFAQFGVKLQDMAAVAVAVFDHGAAPPGYSDRQFRFDYIKERLESVPRLSSFAFRADNIPPIMTRLRAVAKSATNIDAPLIVMDTAPAAVQGTLFDPWVAKRGNLLIANIGNFHTLAFRLRNLEIGGVFEHHTGMLDQEKMERLLRLLADSTLKHRTVFDDQGHGAYTRDLKPFEMGIEDFALVVTGPRRSLMSNSQMSPHFASPFGDMMLTGCFGLLAAVADVMPEIAEPISASLQGAGGHGTPPWEIENNR